MQIEITESEKKILDHIRDYKNQKLYGEITICFQAGKIVNFSKKKTENAKEFNEN